MTRHVDLHNLPLAASMIGAAGIFACVASWTIQGRRQPEEEAGVVRLATTVCDMLEEVIPIQILPPDDFRFVASGLLLIKRLMGASRYLYCHWSSLSPFCKSYLLIVQLSICGPNLCCHG